MNYYVFFFLLSYTILALLPFVKHSNRKWIVLIALTLMAIFSAGNSGKGSDYFSYKEIYERNNSIDSLKDIGFYLIVNLSNSLGVTFDGFIVIISVIFSILIFTIISSIDKKIIFLMVYISGYYLYFQFNAIKQGLSILLLLVGILCVNKKIRIGVLILSISVHSSQILTLFLYYFNKKPLLYSLASILLIYFIYDYYAAYIDNEIIPIIKILYPVLIIKALFSLWLLKFNCSKILIYSEIACTILIHFGIIYISRYIDVIFLLLLFEFCNKNIKLKFTDYLFISIFILILQIGSLNIIHMDCLAGNNIWCNY